MQSFLRTFHKIVTLGLWITSLQFLLIAASSSESAAGNRSQVLPNLKPLDLTRSPSAEELMAAGQLGGALHPTHDQAAGSARDAVNLSFGTAMEKWNRHEYRKAAQLLKQHVKAYPQSPWVSEAVLHLGCDAQYNGRYLEAQKHFESIVKNNQGKSHPGAKVLIEKAKLRLGVLKAFQNNLPEAEGLFADLHKNAGDWRERTYAAHWIQRIGRMKKSGKTALNCGNQALAALLERDGRKEEAISVLNTTVPSDKGHSIRDMEEDSVRYGYPLVARSFETVNADALAAPAIVHLPAANSGDSGHYWLFEGKDDNNLKFFDPQAGKHFVQSADEFSEQWDGIALVKAENAAGEPLDKELSESVFGGCCGVPRAEEDLGCPDGKCKQGPSMNGGTPNGSPAWTVNMVNMNFYMTDIPLWYKSPIGPAVEIQLSYNSQSAIAIHEPFGNKWQFNYSSYLVVDTAGEVTVFMPDGRRDVYRPNNPLNPAAGYQKPYRGFDTLTYLGPDLFELKFQDGIVYKYAKPAGSLQPFLVEIRDTHNQKLTFGYDANIRLTTITDASGTVSTLTYDANGLVSRVADPFGRHADFTYDVNRNLTGITDMGGYASGITYDGNVNITSITNGGGTWNVYIEPADGIDNGMVKYPLPGGGMWENYRVTVTNPQMGREEYYFDGYHGNGWYKSPRHYGTDIKTVAYEFTTTLGLRGELQSTTSPEGVSTFFMYDATDLGLITSTTDGHGHTTGYTYNAMGQVTSITRPNLQATTIAYATAGAANGVDVTGITDGLGSIAIGYNANRDVSSVTDRMGATTALTYNAFGQLLTVTDSLTPATVTSYTYDSLTHYLTQVRRDGSVIKSYTYDSTGRVLTVTDAAGVTVTLEYNNLNDITKASWADGRFIAITYAPAPQGYPHLITSVTDRGGRTTSYTYDSLKRLIQMTNAEGAATTYGYDKDGLVRSLTSPNGGVTKFYYSNDGRLKTRVEPDGSRTAYAYDAGGLLKTRTNGRLSTAAYSYDTHDNLLGVTYSDGTPPVSYTYDVYDRLTGMNDAVGAHLYVYDANSRLASINGPLTNDTITYTYDSTGRRTRVSVLGGLETTRTFDSLNRLTTVSNAGGSYGYGYTGVSPRIASLSRPNTSTTSYLYDSLARLTSVSNKNSANAVISSYGYTHNAQDQRSVETINGGTPSVFGSGSQTGYTYDAANKLLTATTPVSFTYDADGNMTGGVTPAGNPFSAHYDAKNQLVSFEYTDGAAIARKTTYGYNGFGFLESVDKYANNVVSEQIRYVSDRALVHQERTTISGITSVSDYTWGLSYGGGIGGLLGLKRGAASYSYLYDGKGNVTGVLDSNQAVAAGYSYDPFGVLLQKSGTLEQPYRFSTKPHDDGTGLSYYGYRFYSPGSGRWLSRDPSGMRLKEMNLYSFVRNNPLHYVDPLGLAEGGILGRIKDLFNLGKDTKETVDTVTEAAEDVVQAKEALDDPNPKSGFKLLKLMIKNTCGRIPGVGSAIKEIMTGAVETVETAPGGVEAAERQAQYGTGNINAVNQMSQIEW